LTSDAFTVPEEILDGQANVFGNFPKKNRRDVAALVNGDGRDPAVGMPELLV